jgi:hypothetical protein
MVNVNISFDDEAVYDRIKELKESEGFTWKGMLLQGEKRIREDQYIKEVELTESDRVYLQIIGEGYMSIGKIADMARERTDKPHSLDDVRSRLSYLARETRYLENSAVGYELTESGRHRINP